MKKVIMEGPGKSKVVEVDIPEINANQLLVKVIYTGLCHSEWYDWSVAKPGESFGHEPMGIVAKVGENVKGFAVGDRVTGLGGGFAEYIVMNADRTIHVPDCISDEDAVIEPLACLLSVASRVPVIAPGDSVAVVGAGYMGLGIISLLKLKGAGKIVVIEPRAEAQQRALALGATEVYAPDNIPKEYLVDWNYINCDLSDQNTGVDLFGAGFRSVVEFTGVPEALRLAGDMVHAHGFLGIAGYHNDTDRTMDLKLWNFKGMEAHSLHERRSDFLVHCCENAMELLVSGQWPFKGMATNIYSMEDFDQGFDAMDKKPAGYIKGLIRCSDGKL